MTNSEQDLTALRRQTLEKLASQQRMQSWLTYGIGVAVGLAGVAVGLFVLRHPEVPYWLLVIPGSLLMVVYRAGTRMVDRLVERYRRAIDLVQHTLPEALPLAPTLLLAFEGRLFRDAAGRRLFGFQTAKYSQFGVRPAGPVWVWHHPVSQEAVGNDSGQVAIGVCLDRQGFDRAMQRIGRIWPGLAVAALMLVAIFVGEAQWSELPPLERDLDRAVAAHAWPRVAATITASRSREIRVSRGKGSVAAWVPDIHYRFEMHGRMWQGKTRRVDEAPQDKPDKVAFILASYPVGKLIEVAVAPDDPALAVIEPGHEQGLRDRIRNFHHLTLVLLLFGALLCILFAILAKWQKKIGERIRIEVYG